MRQVRYFPREYAQPLFNGSIDYATGDAAQAAANAAAARMLENAEEIQELVRLRGLTRAPGC